jgi:hypothetical protein
MVMLLDLTNRCRLMLMQSLTLLITPLIISMVIIDRMVPSTRPMLGLMTEKETEIRKTIDLCLLGHRSMPRITGTEIGKERGIGISDNLHLSVRTPRPITTLFQIDPSLLKLRQLHAHDHRPFIILFRRLNRG